MKFSAFTLVELMTVLAIIAIIVSLMLESLAVAKRAAQRTECQEAQRQLEIAKEVGEGRFIYDKAQLDRCADCHPGYP